MLVMAGQAAFAQNKKPSKQKDWPKQQPAQAKPAEQPANPSPTRPASGADTVRYISPDQLDTATMVVPNASRPSDTIKAPQSRSGISARVVYSAQDSMVFNVPDNTFYLYNKAKVDYTDLTLEAGKIDVNWSTALVTAVPLEDSAGKQQGIPLFKQGNDKYVARRIKYNYKTKKGLITEIVTQQGEGYLHSEVVKKNERNELFNRHARYTTCNLEHPHFYISASKIKAIPQDKLVAGPFNLVIADVPTPLGLPFGIFPTPKRRSAGIIIPIYGESIDRGFFLRNGGYYLPIGDVADLRLLGEIYSKGSYGFNVLSTYKKRYQFNGNVDLLYNRRLTGEEGLQNVNEDFWLRWGHAPETKGSGRLSANVQLGSNTYNQRNSFVTQNYLSSQFQSNVSYFKTFVGTPFTMSANLRHNQVVSGPRAGSIDTELPSVTFGMARQYPFKSKVAPKNNPIQNLNVSYDFNASNRIQNDPTGAPVLVSPDGRNLRVISGYNRESDTLVPFRLNNFGNLLSRARAGAVHNIPISTTVTLFRYFNLNPFINYQETWYLRRVDARYNPSLNGIEIDTVNSPARSARVSTGASLTTRVYGTFFVRKGRLEAIRQVIQPTVGFSFTPDLSGPMFGNFSRVQSDSTGRVVRVAGFVPGGPAGTPSVGRVGSISFGLQQTFEAKVRQKPDTANPDAKPVFEKRMLIDNLSANTAYNIYADSLNWSPLQLALNTRLFNNKIGIVIAGSVDPYLRVRSARSEEGIRVNKLAIAEGRGLGQLTSFNVALNTSLNPKARERKNEPRRAMTEIERQQLSYINTNIDDYVDFNIPWNVSLQYNLSYNRSGFAPRTLAQTVNVTGDVSLTDKWKVGGSTGYDLIAKNFSFTSLNIYRDLHCWEMRLNVIPFGIRQSYSIDVNVKASILQDLKLSRRRSWYDR